MFCSTCEFPAGGGGRGALAAGLECGEVEKSVGLARRGPCPAKKMQLRGDPPGTCPQKCCSWAGSRGSPRSPRSVSVGCNRIPHDKVVLDNASEVAWRKRFFFFFLIAGFIYFIFVMCIIESLWWFSRRGWLLPCSPHVAAAVAGGCAGAPARPPLPAGLQLREGPGNTARSAPVRIPADGDRAPGVPSPWRRF